MRSAPFASATPVGRAGAAQASELIKDPRGESVVAPSPYRERQGHSCLALSVLARILRRACTRGSNGHDGELIRSEFRWREVAGRWAKESLAEGQQRCVHHVLHVHHTGHCRCVSPSSHSPPPLSKSLVLRGTLQCTTVQYHQHGPRPPIVGFRGHWRAGRSGAVGTGRHYVRTSRACSRCTHFPTIRH